MAVVKSLGGDKGKYRLERRRAQNAIVSEIYFPPRVTAASKLSPELKIIPGFALDLTTDDEDERLWHLDHKDMRERAMQKMRDEKPMLVVGSPKRTAFSTWQSINARILDPYIVA